MEEKKDVKWVLIVSLAALYISWMLPFGYYPRAPGALEAIVLNISRFSPLSFLVMLTTITLYTVGFGNKELTFKVSMYLFMISMTLLALGILGRIFLSGY